MHCVSVKFHHWKRLADTGCNTDTRILAFVGSNESGKSSLLEGLEWLTNGSSRELLPSYESRSLPEAGPEQVIVEARYELDEADRVVVADLEVAEPLTGFLAQKRRDGVFACDAIPTPKRNPKPFEDAAARIEAAGRCFSAQFVTPSDPEDDESETPKDWAEIVLGALGDPDEVWNDMETRAARHLINWLQEPPSVGDDAEARDLEAVEALNLAMQIAKQEHPADTARDRLAQRQPRFVLFSESDRELGTSHNIADDAYRANPQPALRSLLHIADLDLEDLWRKMSRGEDSRRETLIDQANDRLFDFFGQAWNQSNITVRLKTADNRLEVWLKETASGGAVTNIEERSDGLLTFIALSAFLGAQGLAVPPILLIDEAETHLHYDAQADLIGVLLRQVEATQVFYTTHSPGCLPADLGTGIRLMRRDPNDRQASQIKQDFWTNEEPGFAPLLYAMGASAAAFSACRYAVLAEGAADMILLPTLIRLALGADDLDYLDYQIAPGLSNAHAYDMRVEEVAARVVYLTDGDDQGRKYAQQLRDADVQDSRIFSLPDGWATEDLVEPEVFVELVNTLMPTTPFTLRDLGSGTPIVKALEDWGKRIGTKVPGHVVIAYVLVNNRRSLRLARGAEEALRDLDARFSTALGVPDRG